MRLNVRSVWVASVVSAGLTATLIGLLLALSASAPQSKSERLLDYLDTNGVDYSSPDAMLRLADTVCDLDAKGIDTFGYLTTVYSPQDASRIQWAVFNGNYCN